MTENILQITEETSLLALNASIEVARAGEVGKGFTVVASETSDGYSKDADGIHEIIEKFAQESEQIEEAVDNIKEAIQAVSIAVEENSNGVINTAKM